MTRRCTYSCQRSNCEYETRTSCFACTHTRPDFLRIIQQNVLAWHPNKTSLIQSYRHKNPDVSSLNSTGSKDNKKIKIPRYRVYQANPQGEQASGSAIAIKGDIKHKTRPTTAEGLVMIEVTLNMDTIIIAAHYCPPRRDDSHFTSLAT